MKKKGKYKDYISRGYNVIIKDSISKILEVNTKRLNNNDIIGIIKDKLIRRKDIKKYLITGKKSVSYIYGGLKVDIIKKCLIEILLNNSKISISNSKTYIKGEYDNINTIHLIGNLEMIPGIRLWRSGIVKTIRKAIMIINKGIVIKIEKNGDISELKYCNYFIKVGEGRVIKDKYWEKEKGYNIGKPMISGNIYIEVDYICGILLILRKPIVNERVYPKKMILNKFILE